MKPETGVQVQMMKMCSIGLIGAGKMATAIAAGLAKNMQNIAVKAYDVSPAAAAAFTETTGFECCAAMSDALENAEIVLLAVKPQYAAAALKDAASLLDGKLLISIVAGWKISTLQEHAEIDRVIRVMPNTTALVGQGMSCYAPSDVVTVDDLTVAEAILSSVGKVCRVAETQLDAVTGLSGSGPAYVMEFIMGLADGGVFCGLTRDAALELAIQTVLGTAAMCQENPAKIAELRDAVISPAGTTACGVMELQNGAFKATAAKAVIAATKRSEELGKKK